MPKIGYKEPGKPVEFIENDLELNSLQGLVGGLVEVAGSIGQIDILVNEEGLLLELDYNCMGLYGPIVLIGYAGEEWRGLTDAEIERLSGYEVLAKG